MLLLLLILTKVASTSHLTSAFVINSITSCRNAFPPLQNDWRDDDFLDGSEWTSFEETSGDWESMTQDSKSDSAWSEYESSNNANETSDKIANPLSQEVDDELWLDTIAQITSEEVEFNIKDADRAETARQMEEWGFEASTISNALDLATDTSLEDQVEGMQSYRETAYDAQQIEDKASIESHAYVEKDPKSGEPVRTQMVYVDEHECVGCYNCATIAGSTFFMEEEYGRARVFEQWGDDDETIQTAIETCPVDCIHYVPYDELVRLETERRGLNLNIKSRLVGSSGSHLTGSAVKFSEQQQISGNMGSRCNNCPSSGCKNCPMFGVGKNPEFEKREQKRLERQAKKKLKRQRKEESKSVEL